jgi:hypothetical protein
MPILLVINPTGGRLVSIGDQIETYLNGWRTGDASVLWAQTVEDFFFDDPNRGRITRADYQAYIADIWTEAKQYRGDQQFGRFEDLSEIATGELDDGTVNVWFWWEIAGTPIEGSSLVKINEEGVLSETICYYGETAYRKRTS